MSREIILSPVLLLLFFSSSPDQGNRTVNMVFSSTSKDIYLRYEGTLYLCATCKVEMCQINEDVWLYSEICLEDILGFTDDGKFDITSHLGAEREQGPWTKVMKAGTIQLHGTVFRGTLRDDLGGYELSICLDLFIENDNGTLKKKIPYVSPPAIDPVTFVMSPY
jgi:hypothetical protein